MHYQGLSPRLSSKVIIALSFIFLVVFKIYAPSVAFLINNSSRYDKWRVWGGGRGKLLGESYEGKVRKRKVRKRKVGIWELLGYK